MRLIFTIAWRNILRHKGKSLVIGAILFLGAALMTVGNGVIAGMSAGIEKHIVDGFMGDVVLISERQKSDNILLPLMGASVEPIATYKKIREVLRTHGDVERFLPVGKNLVMVLNENESTPGFAYLIGVDLQEHARMFPGNMQVIEGRAPGPQERGLLMPTFTREQFMDFTNTWYIPEGGAVIRENMKKEALENLGTLTVSTSIVMMGMQSGANTSTDIRFVVKGVVKYNALNTIFGHFLLSDIRSYRECLGYFTSRDNAVTVPQDKQKLLELENAGLDSLFGSEALVVSDAHSAAQRPAKEATKAALAEDSEDGIYNAVFIRLKIGVSRREALVRLNAELRAADAGVRAITWNRASGPIGSMAIIIRSALFLFVTLLFSVAIIIIVNTLTMAALERTSEIGMMRAIGARKTFVGGMFLGETAILSGLFGGAGIVAGILAVKAIPALHITSANDMVQLLYGGDVFNPLLGTSDIAISAVQLVFVTALAAVYPVKVACQITPLDAISRD